MQGPDGNFYGVASEGGSSGLGTIFKITPSGTLTVLHSFCGGLGCGSLPSDGATPLGRLVYSGGYYYGTTNLGSVYNSIYNSGIIFRVSPSGVYEIMHNFTGCRGTGDGESPAAGLTLASDGNFYGTAQAGGTSGNGTVFRAYNPLRFSRGRRNFPLNIHDECMAFSQLRKSYLGLMRQVIDRTHLLLKTLPTERDVHQAEAHRLVSEFFQTQEAFANHRREHSVHGQILEEVLF